MEAERNELSLTQSRHFLALSVASLALFWGTGTVFYHFFRLGQNVDHNFLTNAVIGFHGLLGVWSVTLFAVLPLTWAMIFFFTEKIQELALKSFGWVLSVAFLSILSGLIGGRALGGTMGAFVGGKMSAMFGQRLALVLMLAAFAMALFLATERFFSRRSVSMGVKKESAPSNTFKVPLSAAIATEESFEIEKPFNLEAALEIPKEKAPEAVPTIPETPVSQMTAAAPVMEEEVEIEEEQVQKQEEEVPAVAVVEEKVEDEVEEEQLEEKVEPAELALEQLEYNTPVSSDLEESQLIQEIEQLEIQIQPRDLRAEQAAALDAAVERAVEDYVITPPATAEPAAMTTEVTQPASEAAEIPVAAEPQTNEPAPGALLDQAARLVISEGRAAVSLLQRRLAIPFGRASLLLDLLEKEGVIGPYRGGPSRDILMGLVDWEEKAKKKATDISAQA